MRKNSGRKGIEQILGMSEKVTSMRLTITLLFLIFVTDVAILLDIPYLRQIFGFLFLTILPGLLLLQILKPNKIDLTEKFVLLWGLSISFLMLFGIIFNDILLTLGYKTPLSTITLLVSFNIAFIVLAIIGYKVNKNTALSLPNLDLSTSEKAFLIVPVLFPALSIFGMHVMNTTDNNIILMFLLFLIPIYVALVCFFNQKFPKRLYPIVIFLIAISLLLLLALRSNHIIGVDIHTEYRYFRITLNNLHWGIWEHTTLDSCLSISLLPTIYQSFLSMNTEYLYKILYPLIFSISPLAVYVLSKKYVGESYAFLASCFFMFQGYFLMVAFNPRTSVAILFVTLAMMSLFSDRIGVWEKRILFIVFMASCLVSHYATTFVFFLIILGAFIGTEIVSNKYTFKKMLSLSMVILFFVMIFFWHSQVTERAFYSSVLFIENTLNSLDCFFIMESRQSSVWALAGGESARAGIPYTIEFVFTWLIFAFIFIGIITVIRRCKEMVFPEQNYKKPEFLKEQFEPEYLMIALASVGFLVLTILVPSFSHYDIFRIYPATTAILSTFFIIGGIMVSKCLNKGIVVLRGKALKNNASQVLAYSILVLVLIPYFLSISDVTYITAGMPRTFLFNSEGRDDVSYIHDEEVIAAKWVNENNLNDLITYADTGGRMRLDLGCDVVNRPRIDCGLFYANKTIDEGYIYLGYTNVAKGKVYMGLSSKRKIDDYLHLFVGKSKIYANGGSEILMC